MKKSKFKKIFFSIFYLVSFVFFIFNLFSIASCSSDDESEEELTGIEISEIYGWTYQASFTSSSGTSLKPQITIFNENRLDWNMSANNMGTMKYWYTYEKTGISKYKLWWYSSEEDKTENDKSKAVLIVTLGIQNQNQLKIIASSANAGAGSSMTGTVLTMNKTSDSKNTTPTEIN